MTTTGKSDLELMESAQMLLAQASELLTELHKRGIHHNAILFTDSWSCNFYKQEDVTPKGRIK